MCRTCALSLLIAVAACWSKPERPDDVTGDVGGSSACPMPPCTSCSNGVCRIDATEPGHVTCPPGMPCEITCSGSFGCNLNVDCGAATSCTINCNNSQCHQIYCTQTSCTINCRAMNSCWS